MATTNKVESLINSETQQKLINCVRAAGVSPDALLNTFIVDEIERTRIKERQIESSISKKAGCLHKEMFKVCGALICSIISRCSGG